MISQQRPRDQSRNQLGKGPENGENGEKVLMGAGKEFEENGRINGKITADAKGPEGGEAAQSGKVRRAGSDESPDGGDPDCEVEGPSSTEDIAAKAPKHGPEQ